MLRQFVGGRGHYWTALHGVLTPEQEAMLGSDGSPFAEVPVVTRDPAHLTDEDERILDALAADGRASFVDLAAAADSTPDECHAVSTPCSGAASSTSTSRSPRPLWDITPERTCGCACIRRR